MGRFRRYTADEVKELIERYERGATLREIGESENLSRERIRQIFERADYKRRGNTVSEKVRQARAKREINIPRDELERLYIAEKKPAGEISLLYNCSNYAVYANLARYNIPCRPRGEMGKFNGLKYPELNRENLQRWYLEENKTTGQIAEQVGCSRAAVFKRLKSLEIRKKGPYIRRKVEPRK